MLVLEMSVVVFAKKIECDGAFVWESVVDGRLLLLPSSYYWQFSREIM